MARADAVVARERRVIMGGGLVLAIAGVLTLAVVPFARHWHGRELAVRAARDRVTYLRDLTARTDALETSAAEVERTLSGQSRRVLHARSSTLAASALQTFLQDAADASRLAVTRLDVAPGDSAQADTNTVATNGGVTHVPATLSAYGDIAGVAALLEVLASGPRVLSVDRLSLVRNAALVGAPDVVQVTLTLRIPVLPR